MNAGSTSRGSVHTVTIQFRAAHTRDEQVAVLQRLVGEDALLDVKPVFPGTGDSELAKIVVATLGGNASPDDVIQTLNASDTIHVAHRAEAKWPTI